jgi:hypothetical protein
MISKSFKNKAIDIKISKKGCKYSFDYFKLFPIVVLFFLLPMMMSIHGASPSQSREV